MANHLIDVLIPAYNSEGTILESVESIQKQSIQNIVIHVVDDGSTDATGDLLKSIAIADSRICVHEKSNGGIVDALNHGIQFCSAPYLARHDSDDIAYPSRLEKQLNYLEKNQDCVAVGSQVFHIDAGGKRTGTRSSVPPPRLSDPFCYPAREPYIIHPFLLLRRQALLDAGGYRHAHHCEDTDLYWRLQHQGKLHNLDDILGEYRLHALSISGKGIYNGRLMAVFSQLAAISEQRRCKNLQDIHFSKELISHARAQDNFNGLIEACIEGAALSEGESSYLRMAACSKLLEITNYRPYDLELSDAQYIGATVRKFDKENGRKERISIVPQLTGSAVSLVRKGKFESGFSLLNMRDALPFMARLIFRLALSSAGRRKVRGLMGKKDPAK